MEYTKLGNSDLAVSRICLGCMGFGNPEAGQHSWTVGEEETRAIVKRALDAGVNFFDTAIAYQGGTSERFVGRALRDYAPREDVVVATKFLPRAPQEIADGVTGQQHIASSISAPAPSKEYGMFRKTFETPSGTIAYWTNDIRCDRQTIVLLPGLTADHRLFDKQIEHFESICNVLVWDAPSHYESRPFKLDWTMDDLARYVHGILEVEGITKPVLVGQSMGGYISQAFIDLFPGEAAGFVCIDSASLQRKYLANWEIWFLHHTKLMYLSIPWKLLIAWGSWGAATTPYGRQVMRSMMESYKKVPYCELTAFGYNCLANAIEANRPYVIDCPVQLICGEKDMAGSSKSFNKRWVEHENFPMEWLSGAGHNSNTDKPEEVNAIIERFLLQLA